MFNMQRLQAEQWCVLYGLKTWQMRQYFFAFSCIEKPYMNANVPNESELGQGLSLLSEQETK